MLDKIIKFLERLFSSFSKKKTETPKPPSNKTPTTPTTPPQTEDYEEIPLPEIIDIEQPQDGSELTEEKSADVVLINADIDKPVPPPPPKEPTPTTSTAPPPPKKHSPRFLWILDNGHGKLTKGKRSPKFSDGKQLMEYELNRAIVNKIITGLKKEGVQYHNLVPEVNVGNILKQRVQRANAIKRKSDLPTVYVSVHANAGPGNLPGNWSNANGIETWYYRTSLDGRKIAKIFQKHLIHKTGWANRDVRTGMPFYVIKYTYMPAILTENGFFNNKTEGVKLRSEDTRQLLADAHIEAILEIEKYGIGGMRG